jgi:hypothetical protein
VIYAFVCPVGHRFDRSLPMAQCNRHLRCRQCGRMSRRDYAGEGKIGRLSAFSTSESDFTPHRSRAFGREIGSLAEMRHLQKVHGTCDIAVTGDAAEKYVPRDIGRRVKHHAEVREALDSGQTVFEPKLEDGRPSGVKVELTAEGD